MDVKSISVGRENFVPRERIVAILFPESAPVKNLIVNKRESYQVFDATRGRKTRSVVVLDNGFLVLSSFSPQNLSDKMEEE